jgi:putative ABC transport system ATP-binding protein
VVTTHDPLLVARADRVLELHDGRVVDETRPAAG